MKFTKYETSELVFKLEIILDNEDRLEEEKKTKADIEALIEKVKTGKDFEQWELQILQEEAKDLLEIAEQNYSAGFPEYYQDVRRLRKLNEKLEATK